jgi:hypothetical protein
MTTAEIGFILAALSVTAYALGKFRTASSVGIFVGILLIGLSGWVITHVAGILAAVTRAVGPVIGGFFGVSAAVLLAAASCVLIFIVLHGWLQKGKAKKHTFWLSALLAILIVAGATPFAALNNLPSQVRSGVTTVQGG